MAEGFQLTRKFLDGELAVLTAIVDQVKAKQGSATQRHKDATQTALGVDVTFAAEDDLSALEQVSDLFVGMTAGDEPHRTFTLGTLAEVTHALNEWAEQVANEAVTGILKAQGDDSSLDALRTQYVAQKDKVEALVKVFALVPDIDVSDVVIPALRAGRSASTSAPARKGKHGHFYRVLPNGERREQSDRQDSLSSMAWYYGAAICEVENGSANNGKGVSVTELEAFLRKHVTDSPLGKPWQVERMSDDKVTVYGMEIVGAEDPSDKSEEE